MEITKTYDYRQIESAVKRGTRFLILNADDMGMSTGITDGIVRAYEEGLATDISMIQTMPDSARAARIAREKGLNVGVHIDLTCQKDVGRPLLGDEVPSLTDEQGLFLSSERFMERMLSGKIDLGEAEREIRRQVDQAVEWGLDLTHIDSNEGVHNYYPEILKIVLAVARERDLPIRWPSPVHLDWLRADGILTTDDLNYTFYGVSPEAKKRRFLQILDGLRPGITEFIFHPAVGDAETRSLTAWEKREAEMRLLTDPEVAAEIRERGIQLLSFREIRDRQRDMRRRGVRRLKAGSAKIPITPPFPTQLAGFSDRHDLSRGAHDDLHARAISLSDGRKTVVLVSVDLLYVDAKLVSEVRREVSRMTGIAEDGVMVFATHTHSGPEGHHDIAPLMGFPSNPALRRFLVERISCCAVTAVNGAADGRLGFGWTTVSDLSTNRQKEEGPIDDELAVMKIESSTGRLIGALVNFGAHPVIMDSKNLLFCSEYPGHAMEALERVLGPQAVCLFANGACGNLTVRRRGSSFAEVERVGGVLAGHALRALGGVDTTEEVAIGSSCASVSLGLRELPSVEKAREELEALRSAKPSSPTERRDVKRKMARAAGTAFLAERAGYIRAWLGSEVSTQVQVVKINDKLLVGVPAELFAEYGLEMKRRLGRGRTMVVGYCDDMVGYVVTPEAFEEGGYEAGATLLDVQAGQRLVDAATALALSSRKGAGERSS